MNLSHNVSRVKRRPDFQEKNNTGKFTQRNTSQLISRTNDEKEANRNNAAMEKLKQRSQSKPTMGEKTTEEDSLQGLNGGPPSPPSRIDEEPNSPNVVKNSSHATMQHKAFQSANRRNSSNGATMASQSRKSMVDQQKRTVMHQNKTINQGSEMTSPHANRI